MWNQIFYVEQKPNQPTIRRLKTSTNNCESNSRHSLAPEHQKCQFLRGDTAANDRATVEKRGREEGLATPWGKHRKHLTQLSAMEPTRRQSKRMSKNKMEEESRYKDGIDTAKKAWRDMAPLDKTLLPWQPLPQWEFHGGMFQNFLEITTFGEHTDWRISMTLSFCPLVGGKGNKNFKKYLAIRFKSSRREYSNKFIKM